MLKAKPMLKVDLLVLASEAQEMALALARLGRFGPARPDAAAVPGRPGEDYRELYLEAAARLDKIMEYCGRHAAAPIPDDAIAPNGRELAGINHRLRAIWQACSVCHEQETRMVEEKQRLARLRETYGRLSALDVDPARLLRRDGLLDTRLGQIPAGNLKRLGEALSVAGYLLTVFDRTGDQAFVVVAGRKGDDASRLGGLLTQAGWRDLPVPPELRADPTVAGRYIEAEERRLEGLVADHCELRQRHWQEHAEWLRQARVLLAEGKFAEVHNCLDTARRLLGEYPELGEALAELDKARQQAEAYEQGVKAWQSSKQKAQAVLDLLPDYPDPQDVFSALGLRKPSWRFPPLAEIARQAGVGLLLGLPVAALLMYLAFLIITAE
mgnify:CR=1 FL=1